MNSFLQGKKSLSIAPLRSLTAPARVALVSTGTPSSRPAAPVNCGTASPAVEVIKEGDKVVRLVVVCSCGERVEIECLYPGGS